MAGCRLAWPDACRRWLPVWLSGNRRTRATAGALRLITTGQVADHRAGSLITGREATTAAKITVALDDDLDGGPADETARSGIGGTGYEIDLSDRG